jgi:transglutaminase-like putative cysteine protease
MSAAPRAGPRRPHARGGYATPLLASEWTRLLAFTPLAAYCTLMWSRMLVPPRLGPMLAATAVTVATGVALLRAHGRQRFAVLPASLAAALLVAGVQVRLLWPGNWDELLAGLGAGLGDLPATNVPYRGTDQWTETALLLVGTAFALLAAWLAFAPARHGGRRGPVPAAIVLGILFTAPAVQVGGTHPWLEGIVLAVLLCVFLRLERIERHGARAALALVVVAGGAAALAAPRLDVPRPILDYEALARSLGPKRGLTFSWTHDYGPLRWPRTGREVLRIRARTPSYWKAENLSHFDGLRWTQPRELGSTAQEASVRDGRRAWRSEIHVRVRGMMSRLFVSAGTTLAIAGSPRIPVRNAPGTFRTGPRPLRSGQSYDATVWTPRPSRSDLRSARANLPGWTWEYLRIDLPVAQGGPLLRPTRSSALRAPGTAQISFPAYATNALPTVEPRGADQRQLPAGDVLRRSAYGGVYRLAERLREGTTTPYGYVQRVLDHLADGYTYTESPPPSKVPLATFLLSDRAGYCQQFSGAMALLLRMGGVPARVSAGFTPGTLDRDSGEYVVRDTDAHSWVEAYIAPIGWVTFDPTPPIGPARLDVTAQAGSPYQLSAPAGVLGAAERVGDRSVDSGPADGGSPVARIAAAMVAAPLLLGLLVFGWRLVRRRKAPPSIDAALAELQAALAGTGRTPQPDLTLHVMLRRFRNTPAEPYLRTLQAARYGGADVTPTPAMRSALRRELTLGLGPHARLGAWRAIPPVAPRPSRSAASYPEPR